MKKLGLLTLVMIGGGISAAAAHHSVSGVFDAESPFELTGKITEVEWINPHVFIHLDVTGEDGSVESWSLETAPTQFFRNAGVSKSMLQGDGGDVTITGITGRDKGKRIGWIRRITYADGRFIQI
jgi:WD40 repeat protein